MTTLESKNNIAELINKYRKNQLTSEDVTELNQWKNEAAQNQHLFERLTDEAYVKKLQAIDVAEEHKKVLDRYHSETKPEYIFNWPYYAVAAGIILLLIAGVYWYFIPSRNDRTVKSKVIKDNIISLKNIVPDPNKALLTFDDGKVIDLGHADVGTLFQNSNSRIIKQGEGKIKIEPVIDGYHSQSESYSKTRNPYARITIPCGKKYQLTLSDGSTVLLNASTSLIFPTTFGTQDRNVSLQGEAYFSVYSQQLANNKEKVPFIVHVNNVDVRVLGTKFNVSGHPEEKEITTTLLEGSVEIIGGKSRDSLQPGKKAVFNTSKLTTEISATNIKESIAWKEDKFSFTDAPIKKIMAEISRWYNVEIEYKANIDKLFTLEQVPRDLPLGMVLGFIKGTGNVKFIMKDKKIIVTK